MKKHFVTLVSLILASTLFGCTSNTPVQDTAESVTTPDTSKQQTLTTPESDFKTMENEDGTLAVFCTSDAEHITVPSHIKGQRVTVIGFTKGYPRGFTYNPKNLKSVTLPDTITKIASEAFLDCTALESINIPDSATVEYMSFAKCKSLKHIELGAKAFSENSVFAFASSGLESVTLRDGISVVPSGAFADTDIREISIPSSVKVIKNGAFDSCDALERITLCEGLEEMEYHLFLSSKLKQITVPASVRKIHEQSFANCKELERIIFLGDAPEIMPSDPQMFSGDDNYTVVHKSTAKGFSFPTWNGALVQTDGKEPEWKTHGGLAYYPNSNGDITVYKYIGNESTLVIPDTIDGKRVVAIAEKAFSSNKTLISLTLPETVKEIGYGAFGNTNIEKITFPKSMTHIDKCAFVFCQKLSSLTLPEGIEAVEECTFRYCESLKSISIPSTVKVIGTQAFGYSGLEDVSFKGVPEIIGKVAFTNTKIKEISIPTGVKEIQDSAFAGASRLASVRLGYGIESIGHDAFSGSRIKDITLPSSLSHMSATAFSYCHELVSMYFDGDAPILIKDESNYIYPNLSTKYPISYKDGAVGFDSDEWKQITKE